MALHKFLIEHAIWPAMEKRKGNKIREIQRALEKSQYEDVAALQRERLTELLLHCKAHVPAYESVLPDEDTIRQAFNIRTSEPAPFLPKIMSRKKQVIPMLSALWG